MGEGLHDAGAAAAVLPEDVLRGVHVRVDGTREDAVGHRRHPVRGCRREEGFGAGGEFRVSVVEEPGGDSTGTIGRK